MAGLKIRFLFRFKTAFTEEILPMNRLACVLILGALAMVCTGCAPKPTPTYYFGGSASALYASKKEPTEENYQKLKQSLEEVIQHSGKNGIKVPPGVYAHLGYLNLLQNNSDQASQYFRNEKQLYPEATVFMDRMINKVERKGNETGGGKKDA
jgi:hypothetical protein